MKRPVHPTYAASLPPHDAALERAVIGAALIEAAATRKALALLPDEAVFYQNQHLRVWQAIRTLARKG